MNNHLISIIFPTLNEEKMIARVVGAFSSMKIPHEIIISDGGSKDRTVEIAQSLGAKAFVHDGSYRQTIAEGRNVGGFRAEGNILVFLDADVVVDDPDHFFSEVISYFEKHPETVAVSPGLRVLPEYATFADKMVMHGVNVSYKAMTNILHMPSAPGECQIMRKSAFDKIGGYNAKLVACEDLDIFKRLGEIGKIRFLGHIHVYHTCRRAHKMGWPKLLFTWFINAVSFSFRGTVISKEWKPVR